MAITTAEITRDPGSSLTAILTQGIGALSSAINNSINTGRDRATLQLNQENATFGQIENDKRMEQRKSENLRRNFEADRSFGRTLTRDTREDFVTDRGFFNANARDQRDFDRLSTLDKEAMSQRAFSNDLALRSANLAEAANTRADRSAALGEVKDNVMIGEMLLRQKDAQTALDRQDAMRSRGLGDGIPPLLARPPEQKTDAELTDYIDQFAASTDPEVVGKRLTHEREMQIRQPDNDPRTGRKYPERFAPDRSNVFAGKSEVEQKFTAQELVDTIKQYEHMLSGIKGSGSAKSTILKIIDDTKEQLRKAPVSVQRQVLGLTPGAAGPSGAPGAAPSASGGAEDWLQNYKTPAK